MDIYVVQAGDTIESVANKFNISEKRLILDNGITNFENLAVGQTIVIAYPEEIYIVKNGDTLSQIALEQGVSIMQLYRNNPFLWEEEVLVSGEELVVRYHTVDTIRTNAYAFPFLDQRILRRTLPYLTYLSILNYRTLRKGEIESTYDDSEIIRTAKEFGVAPLMLIIGMDFQGQRIPEEVYEILLNLELQERYIQNILGILKEKGFYGLNITITFLNESNQDFYFRFLERLTLTLKKEGYPVFISVDPNFVIESNKVVFEKIDFSQYGRLVEGVYFMKFYWGIQNGPPMPIGSVENIVLYLDFVKQMMDPGRISVGFPLQGYDWKLPYIKGFSEANAITLDKAVELASKMNATIFFDDVSKTPFFEYDMIINDMIIKHIVWFVDARTIYAVLELVFENGLQGTGLWNIMSYYPQLWLIINANFNIEKILLKMQ